MCVVSMTIPLTRRWKVTVACFAVTVAGLIESIVTLIVVLGEVDVGLGGADADLGEDHGAWPVARKRMAAATTMARPTRVARGFMVSSLLITGVVRGKTPCLGHH